MTLAENPFRQPLRRRNVDYKTTLRRANMSGKDAGGNTDFAINNEYVWIAFDFSVPLAWVTLVEESAAFCFLRSGWGYNTKKRDELMARVRDAVSNAAVRPMPQKVAVVEHTGGGCQVCGDPQPHVFDYQWFTSFMVYAISKSDRRILCSRHAASRLRMVTLYNLVIGTLGLGAFVSPVITWANIRGVREAGAISAFEAAAYALASWPYLLIVAMLAWVVHFIITF